MERRKGDLSIFPVTSFILSISEYRKLSLIYCAD